VRVEDFHYQHTYASLFSGRPDADLNDCILKDAIKKADKIWGSTAVHLIRPEVDKSDPDHPVLPPVLLRAYLTCSEPIGPAFDGSGLAVVWLTDACHSDSIEDLVARAIKDLAWEELATDFDY